MKKSIEISPNIETLFGTRDENLRLLEDGLNINIDLRSDSVDLEGAARVLAARLSASHFGRQPFVGNRASLGAVA